jgi:hypothetical protein
VGESRENHFTTQAVGVEVIQKQSHLAEFIEVVDTCEGGICDEKKDWKEEFKEFRRVIEGKVE